VENNEEQVTHKNWKREVGAHVEAPNMKPARQWRDELANVSTNGVKLLIGRDGEPTLKVGNVFLHSRYNPREEAARLVDSVDIDLKRPVLVIGVGLAHHVLELLGRGASIAVVEFDPAVARLAVEGPLWDSDVLLAVGDPEEIAKDPAFISFASRIPQIFAHPPTARIHPERVEEMTALTTRVALGSAKLRIAVVGPMYGGSLPIASYLERGFHELGHITTLIDNSVAWNLYKDATEGVKAKKTSDHLGDMLASFLSEWSYARVSEFAPDICIVMAQAPVGPAFPARLARDGIITAFWYVENWRHLPYWKEIAPYYDVFFHIQPGEFEQKLEEAGAKNIAYVQTGCDPKIHRPVDLTTIERDDYHCDISFAGAGYGNRLQIFKGLTDYKFAIWGVGWNIPELRPLLRDPEERFTPEKFAKIVAGSKINLNLHSSASHDGIDPECDAINPRVFEIAACGGFQLCDPCKGLETLFDFGRELPVYRSLPELRERIDYYLAHEDERAECARLARKRVLHDHTYAQRAQQMLDKIVESCGKRLIKKGVRIQRTMEEMTQIVGPDTELGQYLATLPNDMIFSHENICDQLTKATSEMCYPEKVFTYLREVRNFAETLLSLRI
jgi:spore maturation protein CgeB